MANVAHLQDKNGNTYDIAACEFNGARNVKFTGDVTNGTGTSWSGAGELQTALTIAKGAVTTAKINDSAVDSNKIADDAVTLAKIADGAMSGSVGDNTDNLATHKQVKTYVDNAISGQGHYLGKKTVAQINALTGVNNGDRVGVTDSGTITDGGISVRAGEDLIYFKNGDVHHWDSMDGDFVIKNNAITGATKCKVTYDSKGLVTGGADLAASDIPTLAISKIDGLQTALDGKASSTHSHAISDVTGLQSALDSKQATLPTTGTASATYAINVSGSAGSATTATTATTATNANNINVTKFTGATRVSGQAGQYGLYPVMVDGFGNRAPYTNDGSIGFDKDADTATDGYAQLNLGNATAAGNAGAKKGTIKFYGKANGSVVVQFNEMSTSNRIQYLQDATGTIPLQFSNVGSGDFNSFTNIGLHSMNGTFSNAPSGWGNWCSMLVATRGGTVINQLAFSGASNGGVAVRNRTGTGTTADPYTWTAWKYLATTGNLAIALTETEINNAWKEVFG